MLINSCFFFTQKLRRIRFVRPEFQNEIQNVLVERKQVDPGESRDVLGIPCLNMMHVVYWNENNTYVDMHTLLDDKLLHGSLE